MRDSAMTSDKERLMGKQYSREYSSLEGKDCLVNTLQSVESAAAKPHSSEPAAAKMKETLFNNPQSSKSTASKVKDIATNTRHSRKSAEVR